MKKSHFLIFVLAAGMLLLNACSAGGARAIPAAATSTPVSGGANVEAMPVAFVGIVESIAGNQWVISGTTVTVEGSVVRDGPFNVGDRVKVEGLVNPDGSLTISRLEAPSPQEAATRLPVAVDNTNDANNNDDNSNASNSNDSNVNDDNGGNTNDDNSNDDRGGNSNDDDSNDDRGGNSNDDDSNDDNGSDDGDDNGNDDNGGDDKGGNSNDD